MAQMPSSYPAVCPYLQVADAPGLIAFLQAGFGATTRLLVPAEGVKIMHAEITLGDGLVMISDAMEMPHPPTCLCHYVADADAVYAAALQAGATSIAAPKNTEYGQLMAGITDPAGNIWWICQLLG